MSKVKIKINDVEIETEDNINLLEAAREADIYIPSLCAHPDLAPLSDYPLSDVVYHGNIKYENNSSVETEGCRLCLVDIGGQIVRSCTTMVSGGMSVKTDTDEVKKIRDQNLIKILKNHPHACLTCAQQEGCNREPCSTNVPVEERCCPKFGNCELQNVSEYIGIPDETPKWVPTTLPRVVDEPVFIRDYNLCISCGRCVRACNDLRGIKALGMVHHDGIAVVGTVAPTLKESGCKFCGACVEVCPTGALMDKKTAAPFDRAEGLAPCTAACPVHMDIPRYTRLIAEDKAEDALAVICEKVPFPRVLGRICMHPCESKCRRGEINEPIAICALKRFASEYDKGEWKKAATKKPKPTGKKVAIIGSGPAGMTAAFYTAKAGHSVTVFESERTPGGMLTHTIPLYRLPKEIFDEDLQEILEAGDIEIRTKNTLGKELSIPELQSSGYDATFISIGLQKSRKIEIDGIDSENVIWGIDFLNCVRCGEKLNLGKNVIVIGGGNVAVDVARTACRLGTDKVQMVCLEKRDEMPAHDWEVTAAEEEGVEVLCSWGPAEIINDGTRLTGVNFVRCTCVFDSEGRFCPEYDKADTIKLEGDTVIMAVGQTTDLSAVDDSTMELLSDSNMLKVNPHNLKTEVEGVWGGGDIVRMPGTVIDAIQMGRIAAGQINKYLGGTDNISEKLIPLEEPEQHLGREEDFYDRKRSRQKTIALENRKDSFDEVELTYDGNTAQNEAHRCLQCDLRLHFRKNPQPPELYIEFNEVNIKAVPEVEGVVQIFNDAKEVLAIKGAMNIRRELEDRLGPMENAKYFIFEEDQMYSQRENELLSQYMQKHGRMPEADADDDDLF